MARSRIEIPSDEPEQNPRKKMKILEGSFHSGSINKDEYEKEKAIIGKELKEFDKKIEDANKNVPVEEEQKKSSEKALIIGLVVLILLFAAVFASVKIFKQEPKTLQELHVLNLQGKLKPEQGYVHNGAYSFVNFDSLWYTQLRSPKGTREYDMALRYSPRELENISLGGFLDSQFFNNETQYYVTFNPTGQQFSYVAVAVADFNTHMIKVFEKLPIAACDRNETPPCFTRPIITCDNTDKMVLYVKEADDFRTYYDGNCIVIEGTGLDLVRGVDRVLYDLYNVMGQ